MREDEWSGLLFHSKQDNKNILWGEKTKKKLCHINRSICDTFTNTQTHTHTQPHLTHEHRQYKGTKYATRVKHLHSH